MKARIKKVKIKKMRRRRKRNLRNISKNKDMFIVGWEVKPRERGGKSDTKLM